MEPKTMGSFLTALRKAAGMTQRELAERLHVSDKAVSRWERDACAPDLALLPVLAEIFDVTCDELLRGGRVKADQTADPAKAEKQRQWILKKTLSQYRGRTLLALLGPVLGAVAAAVAVGSFYQLKLGFWLGAAGCLIGVIVQLALWNGALLSLSDEHLDGAALGAAKFSLLRLTEVSLAVCAAVLAAVTPFAWSRDLFRPWELSAIAVSGTVLLALLACPLLNARLLQRDLFSLEPDQRAELLRRARRKSRIALALAAAVAVTVLAQNGTARLLPLAREVRGRLCETEEELRTVMEARSRVPETDVTETERREAAQPVSEGQLVRLSNYGSYTAVTNADGSQELSFRMNNGAVALYRYTPGAEDLFPVEVITYADIEAALDRAALRNRIFTALYVLELVGAAAWYWAGRRRYAAPSDRTQAS